MIRINLLPEEYIEKKTNFPVPFKEISVILLVVMAFLWGFIFYHARNLSRNLTGVEAELNALTPELNQADKFLKEMNQQFLPKKAFLDKITNPDLEWDRVMDNISTALPRGVWLTALTFSEFPELVVRLEGLAEPYNNRSSVSLIGDFATQTKKELEDFAAQKAPVTAASFFHAETFTQQRDSETRKLTGFIVEFRKKS